MYSKTQQILHNALYSAENMLKCNSIAYVEEKRGKLISSHLTSDYFLVKQSIRTSVESTISTLLQKVGHATR